ncbi:heterotrimeric G protein alpha subunit 4 [Mycena vulgaris]|nr:heterotrimeric G protein alpha subunit 4 [Mycena vulgaris]
MGKTLRAAPTTSLPATAKVLLLGPSMSGKSTILKQMRLIQGIPLSDSEIESSRQLVLKNLISGMKLLIESLPDMGWDLPDALRPDTDQISQRWDLLDWNQFNECLGVLTRLWSNQTIQTAVGCGNAVPLNENLAYFLASLPRISSPSYVPTQNDILHLHGQTIGITKPTFHLSGSQMLVVDVGGSKSERPKWIYSFNDVTNIVFVVSLSGYDMNVAGDRAQNQMHDSMVLWESVCASKWFDRTSIILCLNKNDLFETKILTSDIVNFFPDFDGPYRDAVAGRNYFRKRFQRLAHKAGRLRDKTFISNTEMMRGFLNSVVSCTLFPSPSFMSGSSSAALRSNLQNATLM